MSLYDYQQSIAISSASYPFYALIMAAARQADTDNLHKLQSVFPDTVNELRKRYHAPGGRLPEDDTPQTLSLQPDGDAKDALIQGIARTRQVFIDGTELLPAASQHLRNHSPDGFAWGYGGSGPAQLALALALHFSNPQTALATYQALKVKFLVPLDQDKDFELRIKDICNFLMS